MGYSNQKRGGVYFSETIISAPPWPNIVGLIPLALTLPYRISGTGRRKIGIKISQKQRIILRTEPDYFSQVLISGRVRGAYSPVLNNRGVKNVFENGPTEVI